MLRRKGGSGGEGRGTYLGHGRGRGFFRRVFLTGFNCKHCPIGPMSVVCGGQAPSLHPGRKGWAWAREKGELPGGDRILWPSSSPSRCCSGFQSQKAQAGTPLPGPFSVSRPNRFPCPIPHPLQFSLHPPEQGEPSAVPLRCLECQPWTLPSPGRWYGALLY